MEVSVNCDEIQTDLNITESASPATAAKSNKKCVKMSTSKSCLKQLEFEIKKQRILMKEKSKRCARKSEIDFSRTCVRQHYSHIQRIANCVDNILPLIKDDLSLGSGYIICCVCFKPFTRGFWQQHVISKHFYRLHKCLYCDHAYSMVSSLYRHMKKAHDSTTTAPTHTQFIEDDSSEDDFDETIPLQT
uniref:C2H2-type domain-containing protein n=1 Tax=Tetranychus urticae TaxID=32264 RepID=T1KLX6_TETUR